MWRSPSLVCLCLTILPACGGSYPPDDAALAALESSATVEVTEGEWISFLPADPAPGLGFVFYPGGKVEPEAYAPPVRRVAEAGIPAFILSVPLDLAIFGVERGQDVLDAHPEIDRWVVGGHSLGGVAAAAFAHDHEEIAGLALWASYPQDKDDLSGWGGAAASVYGSQDCVAEPDEVLATAPLLPPDTRWVEIEGGNHAQFGSYGPQDGDCDASIPPDEQHAEAAEAVLGVFEALAGGGIGGG